MQKQVIEVHILLQLLKEWCRNGLQRSTAFFSSYWKNDAEMGYRGPHPSPVAERKMQKWATEVHICLQLLKERCRNGLQRSTSISVCWKNDAEMGYRGPQPSPLAKEWCRNGLQRSTSIFSCWKNDAEMGYRGPHPSPFAERTMQKWVREGPVTLGKVSGLS